MPLNLGKKSIPSDVGINLSSQQQYQSLDVSQGSSPELEALRYRINEDSLQDQKNSLSGRVS